MRNRRGFCDVGEKRDYSGRSSEYGDEDGDGALIHG
jgi:hypothetical protein